jgi:hypothetical protein
MNSKGCIKDKFKFGTIPRRITLNIMIFELLTTRVLGY